MLYPKENEVRMISDLSGIWEFKLGDEREPGEECKGDQWTVADCCYEGGSA